MKTTEETKKALIKVFGSEEAVTRHLKAVLADLDAKEKLFWPIIGRIAKHGDVVVIHYCNLVDMYGPGNVFDTTAMEEFFKPESFGGPGICIATRKSDGVRGSLAFDFGYPRFYFDFRKV